MKISLIAALADNRVIGHDNALPWRLPDDMKHFREHTTGHGVVMGRRTFESLGRPLPRRSNIVLTTQAGWQAEGVHAVGNPEAAVAYARETGIDHLFVIGGEAVFEAFLERADALVLTRVEAEPEGDAHFPAFDDSNGPTSPWRLVSQQRHERDARHQEAFSIQVWERRTDA